jgi:hypothetical protein
MGDHPTRRTSSSRAEKPAAQTQLYETLTSLLNPSHVTPYSSSSRHRTSSEISDGLKRIRRIVLTEGIPEIVRLYSLKDNGTVTC